LLCDFELIIKTKKDVLPVLLEHSRARNVDIIAVTADRSVFERFQSLRLTRSFSTLSVSLQSQGDELARIARSGRLALCVGGAPSLAELWELLGERPNEELSEMEQIK